MAAQTKYIERINIAIIRDTIERALVAGVNDVAEDAHERALKDVPVRKIFRYGRGPRSGLRQQGRQETRTLSLQEARSESSVRKRLGLGSAFTDPMGNQRKTPQIQTTLFPGNYRSRNRANDYRSMDRRTYGRVGGKSELHLVDVQRGMIMGTKGLVPYSVNKITPGSIERESDLSARGEYERKVGRALQKGKGEEPDTLGGALRRTVQDGFARAIPGGKRITATIGAGSDKVKYAKYVEFGTSRARAQPFLRPALAQAREELMQSVLGHLKSLGR